MIFITFSCVSVSQGSVLFNWFTKGKLERSDGSSITEGIGQGRVTDNIKGAPIDDAICVLDKDAVEMVCKHKLNTLTVCIGLRSTCCTYSRCVVFRLCVECEEILNQFWNQIIPFGNVLLQPYGGSRFQ